MGRTDSCTFGGDEAQKEGKGNSPTDPGVPGGTFHASRRGGGVNLNGVSDCVHLFCGFGRHQMLLPMQLAPLAPPSPTRSTGRCWPLRPSTSRRRRATPRPPPNLGIQNRLTPLQVLSFTSESRSQRPRGGLHFLGGFTFWLFFNIVSRCLSSIFFRHALNLFVCFPFCLFTAKPDSK